MVKVVLKNVYLDNFQWLFRNLRITMTTSLKCAPCEWQFVYVVLLEPAYDWTAGWWLLAWSLYIYTDNLPQILTTMCQILGVCLAHFLDWNFITAIYKGFLERFDDHWEHSREVLDVTHTVTCRHRDRDGRRDNFPFRETDYVFICYCHHRRHHHHRFPLSWGWHSQI